MGFVEITNDGNPELVDQTNREGLLQSRALDDLRRLSRSRLLTRNSDRGNHRQQRSGGSESDRDRSRLERRRPSGHHPRRRPYARSSSSPLESEASATSASSVRTGWTTY